MLCIIRLLRNSISNAALRKALNNSKAIFFLLLFFSISWSAPAQIVLSGTVLDSKNKTALRFVNIGIRNKNIGCSSSDDGTFTLHIPIQNENDTLTFSLVGYSDRHLLIADILAVKQKTFLLEIKPAEIAPVTVVSQQLVEKKLGIVKYNPALHFTDGSTNQNDIFEIAQLIRLDS